MVDGNNGEMSSLIEKMGLFTNNPQLLFFTVIHLALLFSAFVVKAPVASNEILFVVGTVGLFWAYVWIVDIIFYTFSIERRNPDQPLFLTRKEEHRDMYWILISYAIDIILYFTFSTETLKIMFQVIFYLLLLLLLVIVIIWRETLFWSWKHGMKEEDALIRNRIAMNRKSNDSTPNSQAQP